MNVAIQQPEHIPWVGFFNKMVQCDFFVYLDNVQFKKRYFENRNKIKDNDKIIWLTVPVLSKGLYTQKICDVELDNSQAWTKKYKGRLERAYGKYPFWSDLKAIIYPALDQPFNKLVDLNLVLIDNICSYLEISTTTTLASEISCENLKGSDLILEICNKSKAKVYNSGPDGRNYLESDKFIKNGIEIIYHDFEHPEYTQTGETFTSHLSVLDLIANCGAKSMEFINARPKKRV